MEKPTEWKKIFVSDVTNKGLISRYKNMLYTTQQQQKIKTVTTRKTMKKKWTEDLNRQLSKEKIQMVNRYMKRCSTLLNIREMHKSKLQKNHHIPVRMAIIERFTNNKCWREYGEKGTFLHC